MRARGMSASLTMFAFFKEKAMQMLFFAVNRFLYPLLEICVDTSLEST